jgi:hypothetical protein
VCECVWMEDTRRGRKIDNKAALAVRMPAGAS